MHSFTRLTLTLITSVLCLTTLLAQSPWAPAPVPQGEYVPNQFILRYSNGYPGLDLKSEFEQKHGVTISVRAINATKTDFLITVHEGIDREQCKRQVRAEAPLACTMCEILGNPGGGSPMSQADGVWPNYIGSAGLTENVNTSSNWEEISAAVMENGYNPFYQCSSANSLPSADPSDGFIKIAILDSGIHADTPGANFDDFFTYGNHTPIVEWVPIWEEMNAGDLLYDRIDPNGHGTAVGFLAAHEFVNNQQQDNLRLYSFRVLDENGRGNLADALRALDEAIIKGADIINMSFGFRGLSCDGKEDPIFDPYLEAAREKESLIFCSAGNSGNDIGIHQQWPAAEAGHPGFYTIGATDCLSGAVWEHSNFNNARVDLLAPGTNIVLPYVNTQVPGNYISADGTSFAAPLTAALAASYLHFTDFEGMLCLLESPSQVSESTRVRVGGIYDIAPSSCPITFPTPGNDNDVPADFEQRDIGGQNFSGGAPASPFPNPFTDFITVSTDLSYQGKSQIQLLNTSGQIIITKLSSEETTTLQLAQLRAGVYYLRITDARGVTVNKITKK